MYLYLIIQEGADCLTSWHRGSEVPSLSPSPWERDTDQEDQPTDAQVVSQDVIQV